MGISTKTRKAYSEIDEFISLLNDEEKNKLPIKLKDFFAEEKDKEYVKGINKNIPIKDQNLKEETLAIIALLNLQYWCEDENEKMRLKEVYAKNEKNYQEILQVKYNSDNLFKNREMKQLDVEEVKTENLPIEIKKENLFKRFLNLIRKKIYNNRR